MLRQASYGTIKIGTYQSLKRLFVEHPEGEWGIFFPLVHRSWVGCVSFQSRRDQIFLSLTVTLLLLRRTLDIKSE